MSIPIKVFTGKRGPQNLDDYLINHDSVEIHVTPASTFDELLQKCAIHCHIEPMYVPLFAIWHNGEKCWKKPGSSIYPLNSESACGNAVRNADGECTFEFRIRYIVKTEVQNNGVKGISKRYDAYNEGFFRFMDETVTDYLYRQKRDDLMRDNIELSLSTDDDTFSLALGVAALDLLCISKKTEIPVARLQRRIPVKHLLSKSFRKRLRSYNLLNRWHIKLKFRHFLRYLLPSAHQWNENGRDLDFFQQRYLLNLELCTVSYGVERFNLARTGFITVSADNGITLHFDESEDKAEKWCDFSEITHMTLQVRSPCENGTSAMSTEAPNSDEEPVTMYIVSISKFDGTIKKFSMESSTIAENLASCIDGYYRLLVDAHHYLCRDVCSPALVKHLSLGCHGPITCAYAEELIRERETRGDVQIGDCIIRQSRETLDEYFVNTVHSVNPLEIRNYKMDRSRNRQLGLFGWQQSHRHETLESLLNECADGRYRNHRIPINPKKIIPPKPKHKNNLIVRLCKDTLNDDYLHDSQRITPRTVLMELDMAENYPEVRHLGSGSFTVVKRYAKREDTHKYVVFKSILEQNQPQQNHHIHRSFQESTAMLNRLNHQHFVQHIGMTMSHVVGIWLEYLPHESITTYLSRHRNLAADRPSWFLQVLWQITHACHYLEEMGFAHGNLRGKNVLLQCDAPQPHVKISDSGVRTRIKVLDDRSCVEAILPAPWLAYEFCFIDSQPNEGYPTIEADKWSYGTTVCEILNWGQIRREPCYGREMPQQMKDFYRSSDLIGCLGLPELITANQELCNLITKCWSVVPSKRPPFQQILREIGSALTGDYVFLSMTSEPVLDAIPDVELDLPTYEDQKLTRISRLGEGHFGTVELFAYDRRQNSIIEKVAVKEPRRSTMRQQQEFVQEIETMRRLNHPYIVRLLGITEPSGRIVMEYLKNGSLADEMRKRKASNSLMQTSWLLRFCSQIAEGMMALQEMRLVHRDLALRNILIGNDPVNVHVKISDFGLSRFVQEDHDYYTGRLEEFPAHWYAPECLHRDATRTFGFESDVWSYGVTVWEMFSYAERPTYPPLPSVTRPELLDPLREHLRQGHRLSQTQHCPTEVYNIMKRCWIYDKRGRVTFSQIKEEFDSLIPIANNNGLN